MTPTTLPTHRDRVTPISKGVGRGTTYPSLPTKDLIGDLRGRLRVETNVVRGQHISDGWSPVGSRGSAVRPRSAPPAHWLLSGPSDKTVRRVDERRHPYPEPRTTVGCRGKTASARASSHFHRATRSDHPLRAFLPERLTLHPLSPQGFTGDLDVR